MEKLARRNLERLCRKIAKENHSPVFLQDSKSLSPTNTDRLMWMVIDAVFLCTLGHIPKKSPQSHFETLEVVTWKFWWEFYENYFTDTMAKRSRYFWKQTFFYFNISKWPRRHFWPSVLVRIGMGLKSISRENNFSYRQRFFSHRSRD